MAGSVIVRIGDGIAVNPDFVVSITRSYHDTLVLVQTSDGKTHEIPRGHGESIYQAEDRIRTLLNSARKEDRHEDERA